MKIACIKTKGAKFDIVQVWLCRILSVLCGVVPKNRLRQMRGQSKANAREIKGACYTTAKRRV